MHERAIYAGYMSKEANQAGLLKLLGGVLRSPVGSLLKGKIKPTMPVSAPQRYLNRGELHAGLQELAGSTPMLLGIPAIAGAAGAQGIENLSPDVGQGIEALNTGSPRKPRKPEQVGKERFPIPAVGSGSPPSDPPKAPAGTSHKYDARDVMMQDSGDKSPSPSHKYDARDVMMQDSDWGGAKVTKTKTSRPVDGITSTDSITGNPSDVAKVEAARNTEFSKNMTGKDKATALSKTEDVPEKKTEAKAPIPDRAADLLKVIGAAGGAGLGAGGSALAGELTGNKSLLRDILAGSVGGAGGYYAGGKIGEMMG